MASIRPRQRRDGTLTYAVLFNIGARQTSVTWPTMAEAEKFRDLVNAVGGQRALEVQGIPDTVKAKPAGITVAEWLERHVNHLTGVDAGTIARYRSYAANDINPVLGAIPLSALTRDDIALWVNGLRAKEGGVPSGKTVAKQARLLGWRAERRGDRGTHRSQ